MIELIFGLSIFLGLILLVHGIAVLYTIRKNLMGFVGLFIDKKHLKVIAAFFILVFMLFSGILSKDLYWVSPFPEWNK